MDVKVGGVTERVQIGTAIAASRVAAVSQDAAGFIGVLLDPVALLAFVFGLWRLGVDLGWTGDFVIEQGLFSHWQVWIGLAVGLKASQSLLKAPARRKN